MLKTLLVAGLAAAALAPSVASAQDQCPGSSGNRVVGTVLGAGIGALIGNAIGEHGGKPGGTIIGGVGGGIVGNQIAGAGSHNCQSNRYGYYDNNGRWIPNTSNANGYYDANGHWVVSGSYDSRYGQGQGYAGQPGYAPPPPPPDAPDRAYGDRAYGDRAYADREDVDDGHHKSLAAREDWMDRDIRQRMASGALDERDGHHALRDIRDIRRDDANGRDDDDRLAPDQRADLERRLDDVAHRIGDDRQFEAERQPGY